MTEAIERASAGDWLYDLLLDSPNLHAFVQDFTSTLHDSMSSDPGAIWCSVTVLRNKRGATMASSNDWIHELDVKQYEFGDGPCLTAAAEQTPQYIPDVTAEERWPELMQLAADAGVSSILAFPFDLSDEPRPASTSTSMTSRPTTNHSAARSRTSSTSAPRACAWRCDWPSMRRPSTTWMPR